jgi:hypothetical protein
MDKFRIPAAWKIVEIEGGVGYVEIFDIELLL